MTIFLGFLSGILKAFIPQLMTYLTVKENNRLKLELAKLSLEQKKLEIEGERFRVGLDYSQREIESAYNHDIEISKLSSTFINGIKALIRPFVTIITIGIFFTFVSIVFGKAVAANDMKAALAIISMDLMAYIVTSVIGYWFTNRGWEKFMKDVDYNHLENEAVILQSEIIESKTRPQVRRQPTVTYTKPKKKTQRTVKRYNFKWRK